MSRQSSLGTQERRELAVEACVHPKTLDRVFAGKEVRSTTAKRIKRAARTLGFKLPRVRIVGEG